MCGFANLTSVLFGQTTRTWQSFRFQSYRWFQEFSTIPLEHTPDPQPTVYEGSLFIWGFGDAWGMLQGYVGVVLEWWIHQLICRKKTPETFPIDTKNSHFIISSIHSWKTYRVSDWHHFWSFSKSLSDQWLFLVPLKGGRWHIILQLAVYTTYIPLIVLAFWFFFSDPYHLLGAPSNCWIFQAAPSFASS